VRQVGYLQGLYRDARSTEHKISFVAVINPFKSILSQAILSHSVRTAQ